MTRCLCSHCHLFHCRTHPTHQTHYHPTQTQTRPLLYHTILYPVVISQQKPKLYTIQLSSAQKTVQCSARSHQYVAGHPSTIVLPCNRNLYHVISYNSEGGGGLYHTPSIYHSLICCIRRTVFTVQGWYITPIVCNTLVSELQEWRWLGSHYITPTTGTAHCNQQHWEAMWHWLLMIWCSSLNANN